jgi:hypothetical protein
MWDRNRLHLLANERRNAMADIGEALLAYARANEMTDEGYIDQRQAEYDLTEALDKLTPEAADKMRSMGSAARDELLRDFLLKVVDHNQKRIERDLAEVQGKDQRRSTERDDDDEDDEPSRKRGRGR